MIGAHRIIVESRKVKYDFTIKRNITILTGDITVNSGDTAWQIILLNPEGNDGSFKYAVTIDDSDTPIYTLDLINKAVWLFMRARFKIF